jgi:hypothetical protein
MPDYQKGKIYTIRCHTNDKWIYVGSTTQPYLSSRLAQHKRDKMLSLYKFINNQENNTSWNDWHIELYENYPCDSKEELCKRENEVIREVATINKQGAYFDKTEWYAKNVDRLTAYWKEYNVKKREDISAKAKEYRAKNKDKLLAKAKEYWAENRDKLLAKKKEYRAKHKDKISAQKKEYRAENRDKLLAYKKEWNAENRDKLLAKAKEYWAENRDKLLAKKKEYRARKKAEKEGLEN